MTDVSSPEAKGHLEVICQPLGDLERQYSTPLEGYAGFKTGAP